MEVQRKYGVATVVNGPMIKAGSLDFAASGDWTPATGDVKISKNEAAAANIATLPVAISGMNKWKYALSATEMQAKRVTITVVDSATKAVEDQAIEISTYGNASAEHPDQIGDVWDEKPIDHPESGTYGKGVLVEDLNAAAKASVNAEVDGALNTAIPGSPTADSINQRVAALDDAGLSTFDPATTAVDVDKWNGTVVTAATAGVPDVNTARINDAAVVGDGNATPWDGA